MTLPFLPAIWKKIPEHLSQIGLASSPTSYDHWTPEPLAAHLKLNRSALVITNLRWTPINILCIQLALTEFYSSGSCNSCRTTVVSQGVPNRGLASTLMEYQAAVMFSCTSSNKVNLHSSLVYKMWSSILCRQLYHRQAPDLGKKTRIKGVVKLTMELNGEIFWGVKRNVKVTTNFL